MARTKEKRQGGVDTRCCHWRYWQELLTDDDGRLIDEAGRPTTKPVMVWKEQGEPCDACLEKQFRTLERQCADGRCTAGRDCPKHRHLWERPADWPTEYPAPESVTSREKDGPASITPYHRGTDAEVAARKAREEQEKQETVILPMEGPEAERYWGTLNRRLAELSKPENITQMARRILTNQMEERHPESYGEGFEGIISLDIEDPEAMLARLNRPETPDPARQDDDSIPDEEEPDWAGVCGCCDTMVCQQRGE